MPLRVLLTGHNGYLGSTLGPLLQACGHVVVGLDSGLFRKCTLGPDRPSIPCLWKDVRDIDSDLLRRFDAVVHLASIESGLGEPVTANTLESVNQKAALRLARMAKRARVRRFVAAYSCAVEDRTAECDLLSLTDDSFTSVVLRLPELYGYSPRFRADLPFNRMASEAFASGVVRVPGSTILRPLLHVEDAASAFAIALSVAGEGIAGRSIDVVFDREMASDVDLARAIEAALPDCRSAEGPDTAGPYARHAPLDFITVRAAMAGCFPRWTHGAGVHQMVEACRQHGLSPDDLTLGRFDRRRHTEWLLGSGDLCADLRWRRGLGEEIAEWAA